MNSTLNKSNTTPGALWKKNSALFRERFSALARIFETEMAEIAKIAESATDISALDFSHFSAWNIVSAKNGSPTAKDGDLWLHSSYNPEREAAGLVKNVQSEKKGAGVFFAPALGYGVQSFCAANQNRAVVVVEPSVRHLLAAFCVTDWSGVFAQKDCIFALGADAGQVVAILEQCGLEDAQIFQQKSQTAHAQSYFDSLSELIRRNLKKNEINSTTLKKFGTLWMRNSARNIRAFGSAAGISRWSGAAKLGEKTLPAVVLAAGPSLNAILPHLVEIKQRAILICVDTALRSCLAAGVEPDFIVLVDPQYWAFRHIAGLKSPSSILIGESAIHPAAFRFCCRRIEMCSALFPLGAHFEAQFGKKGDIGAGGSVSTSAWDFAKRLGAREIFVAGLDLGFSSKNTHVRGSSAEEDAHCASNRVCSAETAGVASLFSANTVFARDYGGNPILTDDKMKMFAWWFESNVLKAQDGGQRTFSLCKKNLAIPGISYFPLETFLQKDTISDGERSAFFHSAEKKPSMQFPKETFEAALRRFARDVSEIRALCSKKTVSLRDFSRVETVAALLFATEAQFEKLKKEPLEIFCAELKKAADAMQKNLDVC